MDYFEFNLNWAYKRLIEEQAINITDRMVRKAISEFQKLTTDEYLLLSEDRGLKNSWDEICVDIQGENTIYHDIYENYIEIYITNNILPILTDLEKQVLWLQTDDFEDWLQEKEDNYDNSISKDIRFPTDFCEDVIVQYLVQRVQTEAINYTNKRIERYLDNDF